MTVSTTPLYLLIDGTYGPSSFRQLASDILSEGIVANAGNALAVSQRAAGANMSVDVASGAAYVKGDTTTTQGTYRAFNDGVVNLTISAADATNPRIDIVVMQVRDSEVAGVSDDARLAIVEGTPAASPVAPATPDTALRLATIDVGAGVTSIVDADIDEDLFFASLRAGEAGGGAFAYAEVTANQTTITAETDLTGLTVTLNLAASRQITISAQGIFTRTVADGVTVLRIKESTTTLQTIQFESTGTAGQTHDGEVTLTPAAGSHTYKLTLERLTGTGSVGLTASATAPAFIKAEVAG